MLAAARLRVSVLRVWYFLIRSLAALLLALRSLGPKVLWAHLRRFKRLGAADAALLPRLAAQNRSHAGCALAGYPLASSGRRRFADFHPPAAGARTPTPSPYLSVLIRTHPYSNVRTRPGIRVRDSGDCLASSGRRRFADVPPPPRYARHQPRPSYASYMSYTSYCGGSR